MAELDKGGTVTLEELMVSSLAMADTLAKVLIGTDYGKSVCVRALG
jgi:hypothetical protein